jgi:hypothetical protein
LQEQGRVAQWESARFTRERSLVQAQPCPSRNPRNRHLSLYALRLVAGRRGRITPRCPTRRCLLSAGLIPETVLPLDGGSAVIRAVCRVPSVVTRGAGTITTSGRAPSPAVVVVEKELHAAWRGAQVDLGSPLGSKQPDRVLGNHGDRPHRRRGGGALSDGVASVEDAQRSIARGQRR